MAEVAGAAVGLIVAEEIITTGAQVGVVYGLAKKTLPLKGTLTRIGDAEDSSRSDSLARSNHTASCIGDKVYIFGGLVDSNKLASNELHILDLKTGQYQAIPALAHDTNDTPCPRAGHTAVVIDNEIIVFGGYGYGSDGRTIDQTPLSEGSRVWIFHPTSMSWSFLDTTTDSFPTRYDHGAVAYGRKLVVHGGRSDSQALPETDTWSFDLDLRKWTELPTLSTAEASNEVQSTAPPNLTFADGKLYILTGTSELSGKIHILDLTENQPEWTTVEFATNPLVPGPRPRKGGGLHAVTTGMGRTYLCFLFGQKEQIRGSNKPADDNDPEFWAGVWALQLPSASKSAAKAKDFTRGKIGAATNELEWGEVDIVPNTETIKDSGKSHPGPRAYFGSVPVGPAQIFIWGGLNPAGSAEGDGWLLELKT